MMPDSVAIIDSGAFFSCLNLTSITLASGVSNIGEDVFTKCERLTSIISLNTKPPRVKSLGEISDKCVIYVPTYDGVL